MASGSPVPCGACRGITGWRPPSMTDLRTYRRSVRGCFPRRTSAASLLAREVGSVPLLRVRPRRPGDGIHRSAPPRCTVQGRGSVCASSSSSARGRRADGGDPQGVVIDLVVTAIRATTGGWGR